jgi:hypothetical protein
MASVRVVNVHKSRRAAEVIHSISVSIAEGG